MAKRNYVKHYEEYFGIEIPEGFVIHHIDGNRENNNIDNLIMIPKKLHARYHFFSRQIEAMKIAMDMDNVYKAWAFEGYSEVIKECKKYINQKYCMEMSKHIGVK